MRRAPEWLTRWEYAHRGLHSSEVPENSLAAAKAAIAAGLGIECDIQRSSDGQAMVFHDWELDRLTAASGITEEHTRAALESLTLRSNGEPIPSIEAFLVCVSGAVPLLIEIKSKPDYDVEQSCKAVADAVRHYSGDFAVMSFDPRVSAWFHKEEPSVAAGLVMREDGYGYTQTQEAREAAFAEAEPDFLAYHVVALANPWVEELRKSGLPVLTWTVNSPDARAHALKFANALISEGEGLA
ncbi:hypothetical protein INR77_00670 [Erythrobacter sp. SCSIO 43205]|uniref:glycerophosphodiester phosphodiesterase family protein n=1 Tax=Erythrobacter sp. SCSIO 43205 TaxID=2779361 RepID=UPI001CA8B74E|nr:glycerophosphodiester phosphodiesterase family protein [Erythrobacter sp. SCSIO 43205]UAB78301.1 hypothetical protein INR77_00670 [Erythrobacter sp. SCSIO 43205]